MLRDILEFFKREKIYAVLILVLIAVYAFFIYPRREKMEELKTSPALERFTQAEEKLEKEIRETGLPNYLKERPTLQAFLAAASFAIAGAFTFGLLLDILLLFNPMLRKKLSVHVPPAKTDWKLSMIFKVIIQFVAVSVALSLSLMLARKWLFSNESINFLLLFHTTVMDLLCFIFIVAVIRKGGGDLKDLGLRFPEKGIFKEVLMGWAGYLAVLPLFAIVLAVLLVIAHIFHYQPPAHPLVNIFLEEEARSPALIAFSLFLAVVIGPVLEEIFFRGFCYPILRKKWGPQLAMVISASFFALIHENSFAFWPIFVLGLALAYLYEKRKNLIAPMVLHLTHNAIFITYFFLAKEIIEKAARH